MITTLSTGNSEDVLQHIWGTLSKYSVIMEQFKNETGKKFAEENKIQLKHGSPQTPATQGLVERSNRTWKEDIESYYHEQGKQRPWTTLGALHGSRVPFGTCFFGDLQLFFNFSCN